MIWEILAVMAAFAASVTGLLAVGCGKRFSYTRQQLFGGDPIATAYVWTMISTMVSAFHATALFDAAARGAQVHGVFALTASIACSVLFAFAHLAVGRWAENHKGGPA